MLVPLFILSVYEIFYGDKKKVWLFVVSASLLYQSHMLTTYLYFVLTVVLFIIWVFKGKDISRIKTFVLGSIMIVLVNLWYLIPQIYEFMFVDFVNPAFYNGGENYTVTENWSTNITSDIILIIVILFVLFVILGLILKTIDYNKYLMIKSKITDCNKLEIAILFMFIGTIYYFIAYNIIPIEYLKQTALAKMIQVLQFSNRFFVASMPFIALGLPYIIKSILTFTINLFNNSLIVKLKHCLYFLIVIGLVFPGIRFMNSYWGNNNLTPILFPQYSLDYFLNGISSGSKGDFEYNNDILLSSDDIEIHLDGDGAFNNRTDISFDYYVEDYKGKSILLPLYSYPVYKVVDENNNVVETKDGYNRLIEIELKKSRGSFKVCQYEPPLWLFGDIVSIITFIAMVVFYVLKYIRSKKNAKVIA